MRKFTKPIFIFVLVAVCVLGIALPVSSLKNHVEGHRYIWNGELTLKRLVNFDESMRVDGKISTIEFVNSRGAGASAGIIVERIERIINEHNFNTVVRGQCASACAIAVLLGDVRTLLPSGSSRPTFLMLHAARNGKLGEVDYGATEKSNIKIVAKSSGKFPLTLLNRIFDDKAGNGDGEIYIFREPFETKNGKQHVIVCDGQKKTGPANCEVIKGVTPKDLGINVGD
jgi:hypothetical protein